MRSIITIPGILTMAVLVMAGCDKNNSSAPTGPAPNSTTGEIKGVTGGSTNLEITNSLPDIRTNRPAGSNISALY